MNRRAILVNRKSKIPLHRQLESSLRAAILAGSLAAGERILSSRELQTHLGVSRNTVLDALEQLHAEGYLVTVRGVGTFVASRIGQRSQPARTSGERAVVPSEFARRAFSARELAANLQSNAPLRPGIPALDLFPSAQFRRSMLAAEWTPEIVDYGGPFGHAPLRAAIAGRLRQTRGIVCSPEDIMITSGAQAAFSMIVRILLNRNDRVIVEDPGYPSVRATILAHGANLFAAPVDTAGIEVRSFARRRAKLAYVSPSHQYPTGVLLSLDRRFALLDWAAKCDAWIVEDDYDSEFNYTHRPQPALQGLSEGSRVIYVGTFSKTLSPGLRVGYIVVPPVLRAAFEAAQQVLGGAPDFIVQAALARFIEAGHLARHIAKMRKIYDERRRFVSTELASIGEGIMRVHDSGAGLNVMLELPVHIRDAEISERAKAAGIIAPALSSYFHGKPTLNGLLIGYAGVTIPQARKAMASLAKIVRAYSASA